MTSCWSRAGIGLLIHVILTGAQLPAGGSVAPVDECSADAAFAVTRAELVAAVERRDGKRLLALVADDVVVDFGGATGRRAFAAAWRLDAKAASPIWPALEALLPLGCARLGDDRVMPAHFARFPQELDAAEWAIATGPKVALRAGPRADARIIARLDWELLKLADAPDPNERWVAVERRSGRRGYVAAREIRAILDYRLVYRRDGARWLIAAFVAGD